MSNATKTYRNDLSLAKLLAVKVSTQMVSYYIKKGIDFNKINTKRFLTVSTIILIHIGTSSSSNEFPQHNINGQSAPLNSDLSLHRSECFLSEKNVLGSCSHTLHNFCDSLFASAQCFKGAKKEKQRSSKMRALTPLKA